MARSRLRIGVEHILCRPMPAAGDVPTPEDRDRAPGLVDFLLRAAEWGDVTLYPLEPGRGRAAAVQFWLWLLATRFFESQDHPDAKGAADRLIDVIAVTDLRPPSDISMEMDSVWCPEPIAWPPVAALAAAAARVAGWHGAP
jgi:hypothetical protein